MKKSWFFVLCSMLPLTMLSSHATNYCPSGGGWEKIETYGADWPWALVIRTESGDDRFSFLKSDGWSPSYEMWQSETTPSKFALSYNTLKEYLTNPYNYPCVSFYLDGNGRIEKIWLEPN
jgi:hypothetical protein